MINIAARTINEELGSITAVLRDLEPKLVATFHHAHHRTGSRLLVARELRRTAFIAISHRFAMALLPVTSELLAGRREIEVVKKTRLRGARGRVFYDGSATVAATVRSFLAPARQNMYDEWTPRERQLVFSEIDRLSRDVSRWAYVAHEELYGSAWAHEDPYHFEPGTDRPYRSRTLSFLANDLDPDLDASLRGSELGQAEHLAVALADLHRAFAVAGCPPGAQLTTALEHLRVVSDLAALRDETAEKIVFEADHSPLYRVSAIADPPGWTIASLRPPMNARVQERPGRCPAVQTLQPVTPRQRELIADFRARLAVITDGRSPLARQETGTSAATVSAALALVVADELINGQGIRFAQNL
jgi:hypothetical protein